MNHTPNYNLNQWSRDDRILMDDFNADNAKIDGAIKAVLDSVPRIVTGSYVGDGNSTALRHIPLPGRPKLVFIYTEHRNTSDFYTTGVLITDICLWYFSSRDSVKLSPVRDDYILEDDGFSIPSSSGLNSIGYHQSYLAVI